MKAKKLVFAILMIVLMAITSGCVYSNNKNWDDLSLKEQQEARQALQDVREDIKDDFTDEPADFALAIVDKVEEAITDEKNK